MQGAPSGEPRILKPITMTELTVPSETSPIRVLINGRITAEQAKVFGQVKDMIRAELDKRPPLDVAQPD